MECPKCGSESVAAKRSPYINRYNHAIVTDYYTSNYCHDCGFEWGVEFIKGA